MFLHGVSSEDFCLFFSHIIYLLLVLNCLLLLLLYVCLHVNDWRDIVLTEVKGQFLAILSLCILGPS